MKSFLIVWVMVFAAGSASADYLEDLQSCRFWKEHNVKDDSLKYKVQEQLPAPIKEIHYWSINYKGIDVVLPVDYYTEIAIFFDEKTGLTDSVLMKGESHAVKISNSLQINTVDYSLLDAAMSFDVTDVNCNNLNPKEELKVLRGLGLREVLFTGKPINLSRIDTSQEGWLMISKDPNVGLKWTSVYKPLEGAYLTEYTLERENDSDPLQFGGLLSLSRDQLLGGAEEKPHWIKQLESTINSKIDGKNNSLISIMLDQGFTQPDIGGGSAIAFER